MNLVLKRDEFRMDGVFGELLTEEYEPICFTLEHSYELKKGGFSAKLKPGVYTCKRGMHILANMDKPFETFEITGVKGHTGILFHVGNYNEDSNGCVLLGTGLGRRADGGKMICDSKKAFMLFMAMLSQIDEFKLLVE